MDLKYRVYMMQFQGTLAVKEEVCKDLLIMICVEVSIFHEKVAVAVTTVHEPLMDPTYMVYMWHLQGTLTVKEEACKDFLIVNMGYMLLLQGTLAVKEEVCKDFLTLYCVEGTTFHEKMAVSFASSATGSN